MKRFTKFILVLITSALSLIGVLLFIHFQKSTAPNQITVTINEETTKNLKIDLENIVPGSETSYTINIDSKYFNDFDFSISFYEKDDPGELSNYLSLSISANEFKINKSFKEILNKNETFDLGSNVKQISLVYIMDENIGNEAQNAYANFYIDLMSKSRVKE